MTARLKWKDGILRELSCKAVELLPKPIIANMKKAISWSVVHVTTHIYVQFELQELLTLWN